MAWNRERARMVATGDDHRVTPAELFFDLVFVYAITQVTALMAAAPSPLRVVGGMVVLALLWWCWCCFAWLGNVVRADSGALFAVLVTVMAVVLIVSLAVPEVLADAPGGLSAPLVFVLCYGAVRVLHLASYWLSSPGDPALRATLRRTALVSVVPLQHGLVGFDVEQNVVGLDQVVDRIRQLAATPVLEPVDLAVATFDERLVTLDHGWHLLALVRMDQEHDFVMTHVDSSWMRPASDAWPGSPPTSATAAVEQELPATGSSGAGKYASSMA